MARLHVTALYVIALRLTAGRAAAVWFAAACIVSAIGGCAPSVRKDFKFRPLSISDHRTAQAMSEVEQFGGSPSGATDRYQAASPSVFETSNLQFWDVTVDDVIRLAMSNGRVLRDLGGQIVSNPGRVVTTDIPELVRSDASTGVAAALAAFDAQWKGTLNYSKTENGLRNPIVGSNITVIKQERGLGSVGITKVGQAGTRFSVTHGHIYDADNVGVPPSRFGEAFDTFLFTEARHPLARGGGRAYNAIAGPNTPFGSYNGYWIASIRSDIAEDELRISVRDYVYSVIRGYWLLRFAYDNVKTRQASRDIAYEELQVIEGKYAEGVIDESVLLQAKDRYLAAQQLFEDALSGPPERQLAGLLGPSGAVISGTELGLRTLERRLRLQIGIPNGEGGLLRPIDEPMQAPMQFDFQEVLRSAMVSRPELHRQAKVVERHRLEWIAARNLRLPSVDLVGSYRVHGFGQNIFGDPDIAEDSSMSEFLKGNLQDISAGVEITRPVGNRLAATAERNAMVAIARENAILDAQQLTVSHEVTSAIAELERCMRALETTAERIQIARKAQENLAAKFAEGIPIPKENVLEASRQLVEIGLAEAIARVDYSIALASLSLVQGSLLNEVSVYCGSPSSIPYAPGAVPTAHPVDGLPQQMLAPESAQNVVPSMPPTISAGTPSSLMPPGIPTAYSIQPNTAVSVTLGAPVPISDAPVGMDSGTGMANVRLSLPVAGSDSESVRQLATPMGGSQTIMR